MIISKTSKISKSNRVANARKIRFRNFGISKCFRSTSLCLPRAGSRAPEYALSTSRLLQDPSLAHRQAMFNSKKHRGSAALPLHMRYARPRHNPADQGSLLIKAISAAVAVAASVATGVAHTIHVPEVRTQSTGLSA